MKDFSIFTGFSCCRADDEDRDIDEFIRDDAEHHLKNCMAVTYGFFLADDRSHPLGFATLQNDAVKIKSGDYPYQSSPAVKIGRFGIMADSQRQGFGSLLLTMLKGFMLTENRTGCRYLTLDAYNQPRTIEFYKRNGFALLKLQPQPNRKQVVMYFDLLSHTVG